VLNAQGLREPFDKSKVFRTAIRAGAGQEVAQRVADEVASRTRDGMRTREILKLALKLLSKMAEPQVAARYDLKGAIMRLGPAGFGFETFFSEVLRDAGYSTKLRQVLQGKCLPHEIDIVAVSPDGFTFMVECKYRNYAGEYIKVKDALYTYARFLDLCEGSGNGTCQGFNGIWLATNTKFSAEVRQYAACKGIRLTSWRHPEGESLSELVERKRLYPITVMKSVDAFAQKRLSAAEIMLCRDIARMGEAELRGATGLPKRKAAQISEEARTICAQG
jgi:hypothetical protein